jgi:hypothetical protein
MLLWTFCLFCGTRAQGLSAPFGYILYLYIVRTPIRVYAEKITHVMSLLIFLGARGDGVFIKVKLVDTKHNNFRSLAPTYSDF